MTVPVQMTRSLCGKTTVKEVYRQAAEKKLTWVMCTKCLCWREFKTRVTSCSFVDGNLIIKLWVIAIIIIVSYEDMPRFEPPDSCYHKFMLSLRSCLLFSSQIRACWIPVLNFKGRTVTAAAWWQRLCHNCTIAAGLEEEMIFKILFSAIFFYNFPFCY